MQFKKLFTQGSVAPYDLLPFREPEAAGDGFDTPIEHPAHWGVEAVELFAQQAICDTAPARLKVIEENTVPSWLWRQAQGRAQNGRREDSARAVFDRIAGAAAYRGWRQGLFDGEDSARHFFDEARYALAQRIVAFEPRQMGVLGLDWAYGIEVPSPVPQPATPAIGISNLMIDTVVSGKRDRAILGKWHKIVGSSAKAASLSLLFSDTEAQWDMPLPAGIGAWLNLMVFRHNDGSVNIEALRHATRLAVLLIDLQGEEEGQALAIGYANLAPLLMALALPYDSEAGRAVAAAISGIITAEAYAVSAELAALRGAAPAFSANRDLVLRSLRNHRRAAYGERNDYEKMPVIPTPLAVASCPDLALAAEARMAWDRAVERAQAHGLRHMQVTSLFASPALTMFMESDSDGLAPLRVLTVDGGEGASRVAHSSVGEALARLGYDAKKIQAVMRHVTGARTLEKAPAINHAALRARGVTADVIEKIEAFLPQARQLRHAFTPWVLGVEFCRRTLKIPAAKIEDMRFNLLAHLGFSAAEIDAADRWCYGHGTVEGADVLSPRHAAVFATAASLPPEAQIRMAAAVQGFVSGETGLNLVLPVGLQGERFEKLLLDAWRRGVKSLGVVFDGHLAPARQARASVQRGAARKIAASPFLHTKAPALPKRAARSFPRMGGLVQGRSKSRGVAKGH